jgi:predicted N-acyltransferase
MQHFQHKIVNNIADLQAEQWDQMVDDNYPFVKHAFLEALEKHNCVGAKYGWIPTHIALFDAGRLVAALPAYEKHNNYGEFVFDQAWERAWNQIGLPYYPKLVCSSPYTPVMGQRLLIHPEYRNDNQLQAELFATYCSLCEQKNYSGAHVLFANQEQQAWLKAQQHTDNQLYHRLDCQFHWQNHNYQHFDDFLNNLKSKKRKNINRERNSIVESGICFRVLDGHQATEQDWRDFDYFYQKTFIDKWSTPTLNYDFFIDIGYKMADSIVLVLADLEGKTIAGALMFKSDSHLYGRHWGCRQEIKNLHFETCFYQGIEYAIKNGLQTFEPGAGGEHKIARGFSPTLIESFHWLPVNPFGDNLDRFILEEEAIIQNYKQDCLNHSPFKL